MLTYADAIGYLEGLVDYEITPPNGYDNRVYNLDRTRLLLRYLGEPQAGYPVVLIAGTKGKGSTACFLASILSRAGYRTGLYTSPHLVDFRERIRVDGKKIPETAICELVPSVRAAVEEASKHPKLGRVTFFEAYTALALTYFARASIDVAVLEVGLGGRLDATNCTDPLVSVITPIDYDHTDKLGTEITGIAREKLGILRPGRFVISGPQVPKVERTIQETCTSLSCPLRMYGHEFQAEGEGESFAVAGLEQRYDGLRLSVYGHHQRGNAAVAVSVIDHLRSLGWRVSLEAVRGGLFSTVIPARFEVREGHPTVVLDCAHNVLSARTLARCLADRFPGRKISFVVGFSADKDLIGFCREIGPLAKGVVATQAKIPRSAPVEQVLTVLQAYLSGDISSKVPVEAAVREALTVASPEDVVCVTGSFFVVGEAMEFLAKYPQRICR